MWVFVVRLRDCGIFSDFIFNISLNEIGVRLVNRFWVGLRKRTWILILAVVSVQSPILAEKTVEGTGLAYGKNHAYFLTAPPGWILDTESGTAQGIFAVFYPKGSSWKGPVVMYSNAADREGRSPEAAVKADVHAMRQSNPALKVVRGESLRTKDNKETVVRYFSGDRYGNYEAAAYVVEKNIVANIILTARSKAAFESELPAFRRLVGSYRFASDDPSKVDLRALEGAANQTSK
jgi:hypothetical protein